MCMKDKCEPDNVPSLLTLLLVSLSLRDANVDHDVDGVGDVQVEISGSNLPVFR